MRRSSLLAALVELAAAALALVLYLVVAWRIAWPVLVDGIPGNDWGNVMTYARWLERNITLPFWFPYQGGGVSVTAGYAIWPIYWGVLLAHATGLDASQALRLLAFLSVPFGGMGCYALARWLGVNPFGAFVAGLLFVLGPGNWNPFYLLGFYSSQIAQAITPWTLLLTAAYVRYAGPRLGRRGALLYAGAVLASVLVIFAHPAVGPAVVAGGAFALLVSALPRGREIGRILALWTGWIVLAAGWLVAFAAYSVAANREGLTILNPASAPYIPTENIINTVYVRRDITYLLIAYNLPPALWILGLVGAVIGLFSQATRGFAVATLLAFAVLTVTEARNLFYTLLPVLSPLLTQRNIFALLMTLLPIMAIVPLRQAARLRGPTGLRTVAGLLAAAFVLAVMVAAEGPGYGAWTPDDLRTVGQRLVDELPTSEPLPAPPFHVDPSSSFANPIANDPDLRAALDLDEGRVDLSPYLGSLLLGINYETRARTISLYTYQLSLIHEMWGDEQRQLHLPLALGVAESPVDEVTRWHGINRVALYAEKSEPQIPERYRSAGWSLVQHRDGLQIWEAPDRRQLAATRQRGAVLYIGNTPRRSYTTFFRLAGAGVLPFATAWPVESSGFIDDYSPEELARFDAMVLEGFNYKDRRSAYERLEAYVRNGGSLFIDTGWQYAVADWQIAPPAPPIIPLNALVWTRLGTKPELALASFDGGPDVTGLDPSALGDFTYGDADQWSVSTADAGELRSWARPILTARGKPLIAAGRLGKGKIVWSGMNLSNHIVAKQSPAERELFGRLLKWLVPSTDAPVEVRPAAVDDDGRARVAIPAGARWLLWREPIPFSEARSARGDLPRYRGGPGYVLVALDGDTAVDVAHDYPLASRVLGYVSAAGLALLALWVLGALVSGGGADPGAMPGHLVGRVRRRVTAWLGTEDT